ncbi:MAG: D-glycero-alpha-D-manno-heptose-1,7-bisphosphate 7-phosphatase [Acidobacteriota bacterium]
MSADRGVAAVFLDRDGVLNRAIQESGHARPPDTLDEVEILPGVPEALQALKSRGYWLIVVTNQPDVARGRTSRGVVDAINARLRERLPLDQVLVCYHDDADDCECRKPRPGLVLRAAAEHGIDLSRSYMVGDRWRDIEAGHRAGCRTILVDYAYSEPVDPPPDHRVNSLSQAADWILSRSRQPGDMS